MFKVLKFIWFISLFAGLAALLWSYASVPSIVKITDISTIGKEPFFYLALCFLTFSNFTLYGIGKNKIIESYEYLLGWKYTFGTITNGFFIVSIMFISIYSSTEPFDYNNFGYLILVFLALMVAWLLTLPFLIIFRRKLN
jgi:hypothetical protein